MPSTIPTRVPNSRYVILLSPAIVMQSFQPLLYILYISRGNSRRTRHSFETDSRWNGSVSKDSHGRMWNLSVGWLCRDEKNLPGGR